MRRFEDEVDPDRRLSETERLQRAEQARKAHFAQLALRSSRARRVVDSETRRGRGDQRRRMAAMARATTADRKTSAAEVRAHADQVRRLATEVGVTDPRLRADGTVIVHSEQPGYRDVVKLSRRLSEVVGCYVHVITDDVPVAEDAMPV